MDQRALLFELNGVFVEPQSNLGLFRKALGSPESAWPDFISFMRGNAFSMEALWPEAQRYDARARHSLEVPVFFFVGRQDRVMSPRLSAEFLEMVEAPEKEITWFEQSAHMLPFEEPERFNDEVRRVARQVGLLAGL